LVPWAGEFVGKDLISAVQALRLSENPALRKQVAEVVAELVATQAEDGYLGPFPKAARLRGNWDLWGHHHCIEGLLLWHEQTGDNAALACARRAADLVCQLYLDTGHHALEAGDPEMNLAIIHGLGMLYRVTAEPRYLRMMREIEKDWEKAGDYVRAGLDGREYFQSPRPRWESLHDLQGLLELWRVTGDIKYRTAFEHHWRSIRRWDRRNTGGFSSGEQATGDPYAPTAIETCCTVAWTALTLDYLRLSGDALAADDLELATFNGGLGAQHPSGRWWTYNTPMDGTREASAHTIVFQARAGTPELNCCSVNGPRMVGMLSEWAEMMAADGIIVNYYGPHTFKGQFPNDQEVTIKCDSNYPRDGRVILTVAPKQPREINLRLRVPAWATKSTARVNGHEVPAGHPGHYLELKRRWQAGDTVELDLSLGLRFVAGAREAAGKVSVYRGPLLLAYDQTQNDFDEDRIPPLVLGQLSAARVPPVPAAKTSLDRLTSPWIVVEFPAENGRFVRLVDFASAGSVGTRYRSWLPAQYPPPPPVVTQAPPDGAVIPAGPTLFRWRAVRGTNQLAVSYRVEIASASEFDAPLFSQVVAGSNYLALNLKNVLALAKEGSFVWRVVTQTTLGQSAPDGPPARFTVDPSLPPATPKLPSSTNGPNGEVARASLRHATSPEIGQLASVAGAKGIEGAQELAGERSMLVYALPEFPDESYSVALRFRLSQLPVARLGQIFSAWAGPMDDPLRVCVDQGKLFARIEAGNGYSAGGAPVEAGRWYSVAAVKNGDRLALYLDGQPVGSTTVPSIISTQAREGAVGGNPRYGGNESLAGAFKDFAFYARALTPDEIAAFAK
ncbi:MAG TPA: beta-L-arabinofuranosidase domain-containing protein, partial [Verrucomicrobiae bacterium]|nr:beta-L-arabinofuranosidase domain-containing protein [Verrucomicrobiae bacterium]